MMYKSLLGDFEIIVGDSSEVFTIESPDVAEFDNTWTCYMGITEELEGDPIIVRSVPMNAELLDADGVTVLEPANKYFVIQIHPGESAILQYGVKYWFVVQIANDTIGYKQEVIQCRLKAKKQGIFR